MPEQTYCTWKAATVQATYLYPIARGAFASDLETISLAVYSTICII